MTAKLTIEYDGTAFKGWATQPGRRTVQEELEKALAVVRREPTRLTVAGRTDAGVHALGQVASHAGAAASARSINALLPADVSVVSSEAAADDFDARRDARSRTYLYRVWTRRSRPALQRDRVLWWGFRHDPDLLDRCAEMLAGEHDFRAFTLSDEPYHSYRRTIERARWIRREDELEFWISADSFTRRMVRSLVSFQLDVAQGRQDIERFGTLLVGAPRGEGGGTADACGLYLASVKYQ